MRFVLSLLLLLSPTFAFADHQANHKKDQAEKTASAKKADTPKATPTKADAKADTTKKADAKADTKAAPAKAAPAQKADAKADTTKKADAKADAKAAPAKAAKVKETGKVETNTAPATKGNDNKDKADTKAPTSRPTSQVVRVYEPENTNQAPANSVLNNIVESRVLRVCVRSDIPPFGYFRKRTLSGFDIALAQELAVGMGVRYNREITIQWVVINAGQRITSLQQGRCDLVVAALSKTKLREKQIALSDVYVRTQRVVLSRLQVTSKQPIVALVKGTTAKATDVKGGIVSYFLNYSEILNAMNQGLVDYVVTDHPVGLYMTRKATKSYVIHQVLSEEENYTIGVKKENKHLLDFINSQLEELGKSGRLGHLKRKWL